MPNNEVISGALEFQTVPELVGTVPVNEAIFPALVCVQEVHPARVPAPKGSKYSCMLQHLVLRTSNNCVSDIVPDNDYVISILLGLKAHGAATSAELFAKYPHTYPCDMASYTFVKCQGRCYHDKFPFAKLLWALEAIRTN